MLRLLSVCAVAAGASIHKRYKTNNARVTDGRVNVHIIPQLVLVLVCFRSTSLSLPPSYLLFPPSSLSLESARMMT